MNAKADPAATIAARGPVDRIRSARRGPLLWRAARQNPLAAVGSVLLLVFIGFALLAPWLAPCNPAAIDLAARLAKPSAAHWFGTDELGRDILSRIIFGARISLGVGSSVVAVSLALGLLLGGVAGYYGGRLDRFLNIIVMNAFLSFPGILLAIAFVAFLGPGILNLVLALSIGGWVGYARLVRAQVLAVRERESSQHYCSGDRTGRHRHGRGGAGGGHHEFPRPGRAPSHRQLGHDAE